ncbi:unnamed protein product [Chrysodeixis includens]|uniref:Uncharacterized protein n=1 Tax=Chrysodeixis includens TaxID=689277 RepID=A0A9N8L4I3_CHRIL|nr:unnamed protein product [Chrysodeixis includens]
MNDVYQNIKKTAENLAQLPRRLAGKYNNPFLLKKRVKIIHVTDNDWAENSGVDHDASDITDEENDQNETPAPETKHKKKRIKKRRRKIKKQEKTTTASSVERDFAEFGNTINKKDRKKKGGKRRFVKTTFKETNSSTNSDESMSRRGKPVDIIVHIKMNE